MSPLRILFTASRHLTEQQHRPLVTDALVWALATYTTIGPPVLVHGKCPRGGGDLIADRVWRQWMAERPGWLAEPEMHDARNFSSFRARNQHMVDRGATVCVAIADQWASGTGMTARMARAASIPVRDYGVPTALENRP